MSARRSFFLWRVLLPSWRFFEAEDARYLLSARTWLSGEAPSPFMPAVPAARRGWLSCVFAPEHNLRLFCHDLIERFVLELAEKSPLAEGQIEELASYGQVRAIARYFVAENARLFLRGDATQDGQVRYQLRLSAVRADESTEELFVSPYYPVGG